MRAWDGKTNQKWAKGGQKEPNASQTRAKCEPEEAKSVSEPKTDQNASQSRGWVADASLERFGMAWRRFWELNPVKTDAVLVTISIKNPWTNRCKNLCRTSREQIIKNHPNMESKCTSESMKHRCDFGACDFLLFVESITLKSFLYMIRGTRNQAKINNESMQIRCSKKECTNLSKLTKNGGLNKLKIYKNVVGFWAGLWIDRKLALERTGCTPKQLGNRSWGCKAQDTTKPGGQ